jgi:hypothetical protein
MCFKPIKPTVQQPNSNDVLKKFNQLSLRAAQHNKQHKQHTYKKTACTTHQTTQAAHIKKTNTMIPPAVGFQRLQNNR